jgi:hypothetical protein
MTDSWAVLLDAKDGEAAGALFDHGVEVLEECDRLWLRGTGGDEGVVKSLQRIPALGRFAVGTDGLLTPIGKQAPTGELPEGDWKPLEQWLRLKPPIAMLPGVLRKKATIRLVRVASGLVSDRHSHPSPPTPLLQGERGERTEASGLLLDIATWAKHAETASAMRLSSLQFAADEQRALVTGRPLPPLPGMRLAIVENIAMPLGWLWSPAMSPKDVRTILGADDDFVLWLPDRPVEFIAKNSFVAASRSAVRLTVGGDDG